MTKSTSRKVYKGCFPDIIMEKQITKQTNPLRDGNRNWNTKGWAFSMLSDVQEMVEMELSKEQIREQINQVKKVLMGKYKVIEDGFSIEVEQSKKEKAFEKSLDIERAKQKKGQTYEVIKAGTEGKVGDIVVVDWEYFDGALISNITQNYNMCPFGMGMKNGAELKEVAN